LANDTQRMRTEVDNSSIITARRVNERLQQNAMVPGGIVLDRLSRGSVIALASNAVDYRVFLPQTSGIEPGWSIKIFADAMSDTTLNVLDFSGNGLLGLNAGECIEFILTNTSTSQGSF
jgi:hypothetical protein